MVAWFKKVLPVVALVMVIIYVAHHPESSAKTTNNITKQVGDTGEGVGNYITQLKVPGSDGK